MRHQHRLAQGLVSMLSWRALCSCPLVLTDHTCHLLWPMEQEALNALGRGDGARGGWCTEGECRHVPSLNHRGQSTHAHSSCTHLDAFTFRHTCAHTGSTHTHTTHTHIYMHTQQPPAPREPCVWWGDCTPGCSVCVLVLTPSVCLCLSPEHCQRDRPQSGLFVSK